MSNPVGEPLRAGVPRAVAAAVDLLARLHPVADHLAAAMGAHRGARMDGAFEAVEVPGLAFLRQLERLVVFVSADIAASHDGLLSSRMHCRRAREMPARAQATNRHSGAGVRVSMLRP